MKKTLIILLALFFSFSIKAQINFDELQKSVVKIHCFNKSNELISNGSGVVISAYGEVITNWHLFDDLNVYNAEVEMYNGDKFKIELFNKINSKNDLVQFKIENSRNKVFNYLDLFNGNVKYFEKVYSIGSPVGVKNVVSKGKITSIQNDVGRLVFDATIDHGSSGGALINEKGQLIGITCGGIDSRVKINFAINVSEIKKMSEINEIRFYDESKVPGNVKFNISFTEKPNSNILIIVNGYIIYNKEIKGSALVSTQGSLLPGKYNYQVFIEDNLGFSFEQYEDSFEIQPNVSTEIKINSKFAQTLTDKSPVFQQNKLLTYSSTQITELTNYFKIRPNIIKQITIDPISIEDVKSFSEEIKEYRLKYEITNNSEYDYKLGNCAHGDPQLSLSIIITIYTEEGKTYTSNTRIPDILSHNSVFADITGQYRGTIKDIKVRLKDIRPY